MYPPQAATGSSTRRSHCALRELVLFEQLFGRDDCKFIVATFYREPASVARPA
jgi:hypothetical protein